MIEKILYLLLVYVVSGSPKTRRQASKGGNLCSSGICVPYYLCKQGDIVVDGEGIIDLRALPSSGSKTNLVGGNCENFLDVCCSSVQEKPVIAFTPNSTVDQNICGRRNKAGLDVRVVYNKTKDGYQNQAQPGEFPWMVAVLRKAQVPVKNKPGQTEEKNLYVCGGSLIHPQAVLTVAHCTIGQNPRTLLVRLGEWDTQTTQEYFSHIDKQVLSIVEHPNFSRSNLFEDIAIIFLESPVEITLFINTICLPPPDYRFNPVNCLATGWGKDSFGAGGKYQNILKMVHLPLIPVERCLLSLRKTRLGKYFCLHDTFICAGGQKNEDTCKGDGGSPLVCKDAKTNYYYQAGIVAWGIGCGEDGTPGAYTNVQRYVGWIDATIQQTLHLPVKPFSFQTDGNVLSPRFQQCKAQLQFR